MLELFSFLIKLETGKKKFTNMEKYNTMDFSQQLPTMDYDRTYQYITNPSKNV